MNIIRQRAGLDDVEESDFYFENTSNVNEKLLENAILQERQFELYAEGKRWFDLVRTGKAIEVMNTFYEDYSNSYGETNFQLYTDDWQLLWPITQDIMNENLNLKQTGEY